MLGGDRKAQLLIRGNPVCSCAERGKAVLLYSSDISGRDLLAVGARAGKYCQGGPKVKPPVLIP